MRLLRRFWRDVRGGTAIEYGLILGLIFVVMVGAFQLLAGKVIGTWDYVNTQVSNASPS